MWIISMILAAAKYFLGTSIGKYAALGIAATLLLGGLYGGCKIKSCIEAKKEMEQYRRADEIRQKEDPKVDQFIDEQKKRVDQMATPGDFDRELERLRRHGADSHQ